MPAVQSAPSATAGQEQIGFSIDPVRYDIWLAYKKLAFHYKRLTEQAVRFGGVVKTRDAIDALTDLQLFIEDVDLKNQLYYKNSRLNDFFKFHAYYYLPQLTILSNFRRANREKTPADENGFSLFHYRRWKKLCRYFIDVSGIGKFERPKEVSADQAFSKLG